MQDEEWLEQIEISLTEEEIEALGWQPERTWWAMGCFVILVGLSGIISLKFDRQVKNKYRKYRFCHRELDKTLR